MIAPLRFVPLALLALPLLQGCSRAPAATVREGPADAVRVGLPDAAVSEAADPEARAQWSAAGRTVRYGAAGAAPLLVLECAGGQLAVTRNIPAEIGAQALFALQGPSHILRLPVDATGVPGQRGYVWKGAIPASDPRLALFGSAFNGTLPGGGMIKASGSSLAIDLIRRCRADADRNAG